MPRRARVRFCNNPVCELCDVILRPQEILQKGGRKVCPRCLEEVAVQETRRRGPRLRSRADLRRP
ncbi:MAG: hypothetical protein HYV61_12255 [Candidatus Rokubacteria bacterium]|nr:hypothetical protein [Candidatus Rokubacteria bacterium]